MEPHKASPPSGRLSVLVVSNDPAAARAYGLLLQCAGHDPRLVLTAPEALAAARAEPPDVVLLDADELGPAAEAFALGLRRGLDGRRALLVEVADRRLTDGPNGTGGGGCFDLRFDKPIDPDVLVDLLDRFARAAPA